MKKAFTLVELIIVIGIIAILAGVLMSTFGSSKEAALSARCLSNLKNLANAASSYALAVTYFPPAASYESTSPDLSDGLKNVKLKYYEHTGWISWYSKDVYPSASSQKSACRSVSLYSTVTEDVRYVMEHGSLYRYTSGNTSTYLCPEHKQKCPTANWSYFMNPNVSGAGYGKKIAVSDDRWVSAERVLLFAEIPFQGPGEWFPSGEGATEDTDAVIQSDKENIGFNHKNGRYWVANVVFADGHVEKLRASTSGKEQSGSNLRELTEWLCEGYDVTIGPSGYEKVANVDNTEND